MAGERSLFEARRTAIDGQKAQLTERIAQLQEEIRGLEAQVAAKRAQTVLIKKELGGVEQLYKQNLVPIQRLTVLAARGGPARRRGGPAHLRDRPRQGEDHGDGAADHLADPDPQARGRDRAARGAGKIGELSERKVAAEDQLKRVDIRAPQDGLVHQMTVHTVGGVVTPAEPIMLIVPQADEPGGRGPYAPQDIDQVRVGQRVRFASPPSTRRRRPS